MGTKPHTLGEGCPVHGRNGCVYCHHEQERQIGLLRARAEKAEADLAEVRVLLSADKHSQVSDEGLSLGTRVRLLRENRDEWQDHAKVQNDRLCEAEAQAAAMRAALDDLWAAIQDRLLARGPLSKEYAHSVSAKVKSALSSDAGRELLKTLEVIRTENERGTKELTAAREAVKIANAKAGDVWFWQGKGDEPESLTCPVVMSADTLRDLLRVAEAAKEWKRVGHSDDPCMDAIVDSVDKLDAALAAWEKRRG